MQIHTVFNILIDSHQINNHNHLNSHQSILQTFYIKNHLIGINITIQNQSNLLKKALDRPKQKASLQSHTHAILIKKKKNFFFIFFEYAFQLLNFTILMFNLKSFFNYLIRLKFLVYFDLYRQPVDILYRGSKVRSKTGGFLSITMIIVFYFLVQDNINSFLSFQSYEFQINNTLVIPQPTFILEEGLTMGIKIEGQERSNPNRAFLVKFINYEKNISEEGVFQSQRKLQYLSVPCSQQIWNKYGTSVLKSLRTYANEAQSLYCAPPQLLLKIGGRVSSNQSIVKIAIKRNPNCSNNCDKTLGKVVFLYPATIVQPSKQSFKSFYLNDDIQVKGDSIKAVDLYFSQKNIDDKFANVWPNAQAFKNKGQTLFKNLVLEHIYNSNIIDQTEAVMQINIRKSPLVQTIQRSLYQAADLLSFIGGLFGILSIFVQKLIQEYNESIYKLQMSSSLKYVINGEKKEFDFVNGFNLFSFFYMLLVSPFINYEAISSYDQCRWFAIQNSEEDISIDRILKRISSLQDFLSQIFNQNFDILSYKMDKERIANQLITHKKVLEQEMVSAFNLQDDKILADIARYKQSLQQSKQRLRKNTLISRLAIRRQAQISPNEYPVFQVEQND